MRKGRVKVKYVDGSEDPKWQYQDCAQVVEAIIRFMCQHQYKRVPSDFVRPAYEEVKRKFDKLLTALSDKDLGPDMRALHNPKLVKLMLEAASDRYWTHHLSAGAFLDFLQKQIATQLGTDVQDLGSQVGLDVLVNPKHRWAPVIRAVAMQLKGRQLHLLKTTSDFTEPFMWLPQPCDILGAAEDI